MNAGIVFDYNRETFRGDIRGDMRLSSNLVIFESKEHNTCRGEMEQERERERIDITADFPKVLYPANALCLCEPLTENE